MRARLETFGLKCVGCVVDVVCVRQVLFPLLGVVFSSVFGKQSEFHVSASKSRAKSVPLLVSWVSDQFCSSRRMFRSPANFLCSTRAVGS